VVQMKANIQKIIVKMKSNRKINHVVIVSIGTVSRTLFSISRL
jgi:hypothetical protein